MIPRTQDDLGRTLRVDKPGKSIFATNHSAISPSDLSQLRDHKAGVVALLVERAADADARAACLVPQVGCVTGSTQLLQASGTATLAASSTSASAALFADDSGWFIEMTGWRHDVPQRATIAVRVAMKEACAWLKSRFATE
jgi:hypothetical protein